MENSQRRPNPDDSVTRHMHQDYTSLHEKQTVGDALDELRRHPPRGRIIYFYVLDDQERLCGIVPTRRLVLSLPDDFPSRSLLISMVFSVVLFTVVVQGSLLEPLLRVMRLTGRADVAQPA